MPLHKVALIWTLSAALGLCLGQAWHRMPRSPVAASVGPSHRLPAHCHALTHTELQDDDECRIVAV